MAFDLNAFGSYGSGILGDVSDPDKTIINAYAAVEDINTYDFLANPYHNSDFVAWRSDECVGCQVMLHAAACKSGARGYSLCGRYLIATITDAFFEVEHRLRVTIDKSTAAFQAGKDSYFWQAILIPEFKSLTLNSSYSIKPLGAELADTSWEDEEPVIVPIGGVVVLKCSDTLTLNGGHIDLRGGGWDYDMPTSYRPNASHETNGKLDADQLSGSENSITKDKLLVNVGDGACLIMAKNINCKSGSSRIGNPNTYGVQYCRGAADSADTPANVSNIGGSTIAIVTHQFTNFTPALIAKYHSGDPGRGLARAYLAVLNAHNSPKPDEGLYALDTLKRTERVKNMCNITGFGNAQDGSYDLSSYSPEKCWNAYAKVESISGRVYSISKRSISQTQFVDFAVGRLVMLHQMRNATADDWEDGRFFMSRITAVSGNTVTIKHNFSFNLSKYNVQMIVVPEFQNLTLGTEYTNAPAYDSGSGGIFAIAVNGTCNLSGGSINMESKGTKGTIKNTILSNYSMKGALPLGNGHGSVFILARNLTMNTSTRLGATYDGSHLTGFSHYGTVRDNEETGAQQGAHVLIISDNIDGLNLAALSTGGDGAGAGYRNTEGTAGACFVSCNNFTNQNTTNLVLS